MGCLLFHRWRSWEKISHQCKEQLVCSDCGEKDERSVEHIYSAWSYLTENKCEQIRICSECDYEDKKTEHIFSDYQYYEEGCCSKRRICERCKAAQFIEACDDFITSVDEDKCIERKICKRCGDETLKSISHIWNKNVNTYADCITQ